MNAPPTSDDGQANIAHDAVRHNLFDAPRHNGHRSVLMEGLEMFEAL